MKSKHVLQIQLKRLLEMGMNLILKFKNEGYCFASCLIKEKHEMSWDDCEISNAGLKVS